MKWLRSPLLHFLLIGAAIYGAFSLFGSRSSGEPNNTVLVTTGELDWLAQTFGSTWNRAPTPQELTGLVKAYIREQVLYREAFLIPLFDEQLYCFARPQVQGLRLRLGWPKIAYEELERTY